MIKRIPCSHCSGVGWLRTRHQLPIERRNTIGDCYWCGGLGTVLDLDATASEAEELEVAWDEARTKWAESLSLANEKIRVLEMENEAWKLRAEEDALALVRVRNLCAVWRSDAQRSTQTETGYTVRGKACIDAADLVLSAIHGDGEAQ